MKITSCLTCLTVATIVFSGCATSSQSARTSPVSGEEVRNSQAQADSSQQAGAGQALNTQRPEAVPNRFNAQMILMADQIEKNMDRKNLENTFLVTSFTDLNRLSETTAFGRLVAENLMNELQVRKWKIFELRLAKDVVINESGEFSLSRDVKKLKDSYKVGGVVTGTYSVAGSYIIVNARVIDVESGLVVSSAQTSLPVSWFRDTLFSEENPRTMKIIGDTSYGWSGDALRPSRNEGKAR